MKKISRLSFTQIQILLWLLVFGLNFFYVFQTDDSLWWAFFNSLANVCFSALIVYGNALWLMPAFYKKKKLMLYCTLSLFLIVSVTFARTQLVALVWCYIKRGTQEFLKYGNNNGPQFKVYVSIFLSTVMVYIFSIAFRYVLDFFTIRQQQETLKKQHAEAQLNLLKAQVQPHFLFNTLNNIYYTAQEESPLTAELIERLSSIMRYFLEEGPRKYIFLNTELDFIKNYIALEKIRMRFPLKVSENVVNVDTGTVKIPPMLLIPLVENVFKHGINKREKDNFITLDITRRQKLSFKVSNKVQDDMANTQHGTGLANLKNRLNILYGLNYLLTEVKGNGIYSVELIIPV